MPPAAALALPSPALSLCAHSERPLLAAGLSSSILIASPFSGSPTTLEAPPSQTLLFATPDTLLSAHASPEPHLLLQTPFSSAAPRALPHTHAITALSALPGAQFLAGAADGSLLLYDARLPGDAVAVHAHHHGDYVSAIAPLGCAPGESPSRVLAAAADGALLAYDLRVPPRPQLLMRAAADEFEDDLLSLAVVPACGMAAAGTMSGAVNVYDLRFAEGGEKGEAAAHVDRFYGHPECVNAIVPVGGDGLVVTASSDGVVRVVDVVGKKLVGVLDYEGGEMEMRNKKKKKKKAELWPVEDMVSVQGVHKPLFALLGHEDVVRIVDGAVLVDDDDEEDEDEKEKEKEKTRERELEKEEAASDRKRKKKKKRRTTFEEDRPREMNTFFDDL